MSFQFIRTLRSHPLGQKYPLSVLRRYIYWQCRRRLRREPLTFVYVNGTQLRARHGWPVTTGTYYFGLLEFEALAFLGHLLSEHDVFIDVGAHVGTYTLAAASAGAAVIAIEPATRTIGLLQEHVKLNALSDKVTIQHVALGPKPGMARIRTDLGQQNYVVKEGSGNTEEVTRETLDSICTDMHPIAIKIDVEGYELQVLRGGASSLKDPALKAIVIETMGLGRRYETSDEEVVAHLEQLGFRPMDYDPFTRSLATGTEDKPMRIMVRDQEIIRSKVMSSPAIHVGRSWKI